jgi:mannopine transport system substrate-binding protein
MTILAKYGVIHLQRIAARKGIQMLALASLFVSGAAQAAEVIVATTGGIYDRALKEAWFVPFERTTWIKVVTVPATDAEMRAKAQAMNQAKNVTWDAILNTEIWADSPGNRAFSEDLTEFCKEFAGRTDLIKNTCSGAGVKYSVVATLLAYNDKTYAGRKPQVWADFWNTKEFPGSRALPNLADPWRIYAAALMADGVPANKLFPIDVPRALRKLDEIKPSIALWWRTGDQSQRGFRQGDYAMGMIWSTRASALKAEGLPVAVSFDQSFLLADTMQILKGSPNTENTKKLLRWFLNSAEAQAQLAEKAAVLPISTKAGEFMSPPARANMPSDMSKVIVPDTDWINKNQASMLETWNKWIQQ